MTNRGVVYIVWGNKTEPKLQAMLNRSIASLRRVHPDLPSTVRELPDGASLLDKASMYELSPYEQTLYLDADTEVVGRLDAGFEKAAKFGVACSICEAPFGRRYKSLRGDLVEYNTGVIFFSRGGECARLFARWTELAHTLDSSIQFEVGNRTETMPCNDQAGFAGAFEELGMTPFVLPLNWNYRPRWMPCVYGPVKVWHDYAPLPEGLRSIWENMERGSRLSFLRMQGDMPAR
jgi:hypothetical protein